MHEFVYTVTKIVVIWILQKWNLRGKQNTRIPVEAFERVPFFGVWAPVFFFQNMRICGKNTPVSQTTALRKVRCRLYTSIAEGSTMLEGIPVKESYGFGLWRRKE